MTWCNWNPSVSQVGPDFWPDCLCLPIPMFGKTWGLLPDLPVMHLLRIGDTMLGRPCLAFDSVVAGPVKDRMLSCVAMGALELTFWEAYHARRICSNVNFGKDFQVLESQAVLDVVEGR